MSFALPPRMTCALVLLLHLLGAAANVAEISQLSQRTIAGSSAISQDTLAPSQGREITVQRDNSDQPADLPVQNQREREAVPNQSADGRYTDANFLSDAAKLQASLLHAFINESGYEIIQNDYDAYYSKAGSQSTTDGDVIQRVAERISAKLGRYASTVQRLRQFAEAQLRSYLAERSLGMARTNARSQATKLPNDTKLCCSNGEFEVQTDGFYRSRVARGASCKLQSRLAMPDSFALHNFTIDTLMSWVSEKAASSHNVSSSSTAAQRSSIKFAHMQTIEGLLQETPARSFRDQTYVGALPNDAASSSPSLNAAECTRQLSDLRRRDFYFRVMAPRRKVVAFIIDHATQIRDNELLFLKAAARFLLNTVNENDLVAFIALDGTRVRVFDAAHQNAADALIDNDCVDEDAIFEEPNAVPSAEPSAAVRPQLVSRGTAAVKRQIERIVSSLTRGGHSGQLANSTATAFDRAFRLLQMSEALLSRGEDDADLDSEADDQDELGEMSDGKYIKVTKIESAANASEAQPKPSASRGVADRNEALLVINYVSRGRLTDMTEHQPVLSRVRRMNAALFTNRVIVNAYLVQQDYSTQLYEPTYMRSMACQCEPESSFGVGARTSAAPIDGAPPTGDFVVVNRTNELFELGIGRSLLRASQSRSERPFPMAHAVGPLAISDFADLRAPTTSNHSGGSTKNGLENVQFTMPYFDAEERSVLLGIGSRVLGIDGATSLGAVGIDVPLSDLLSDVLFANVHADSRALENAYVLYVTGVATRKPSAYVVWHSALRRTTIDKVPIGDSVEQFEIPAGFRRVVLPAMFSSLSANRDKPQSMFIELDAAASRREAALDLQIRDWFVVRGAARLRITYTWKQISSSPFVLLTKRFEAVPHDIQTKTAASTGNSSAGSGQLAVEATTFVWHRIDATSTHGNPRRTCLLNRQLVTFESSGVYVAPRSFEEPFEYLATVYLASSGSQTQAQVGTAASASELAATSSSLTEVRIAQLITESGSSFGAQPFEVALKPRVRTDVALSFVLDAHWRQSGRPRGASQPEQAGRSSSTSRAAEEDAWRRLLDDPFSAFYSVRRYFATSTGVLRVYPATPLKRQFDATQRDWFVRATYQPRRLLVTMPFYDPAGAGLIVTMSRAVLDRREEDAASDANVMGVIAMDVPVRSVYQRLVRSARHCGQATGWSPTAASGLKEPNAAPYSVRCFLMDEFGYMVVHPRYIFANLSEAVQQHFSAPGSSRNKADREKPFSAPEQRHLSYLEPRIANDLLLNHRSAVRKYECRTPLAFDVAQTRIGAVRDVIQRYYVMNSTEYRVVSSSSERARARGSSDPQRSGGEHCLRYSIVRLNGSNLFFGVVNDSCRERDAIPFCPCNLLDHTCFLCDRPNEPTKCECPCRCPNNLLASLPGNNTQSNGDCARRNASNGPFSSNTESGGRRTAGRASSPRNATENIDNLDSFDDAESDGDARFGVPYCYATASSGSSAFVPINVREYAYTPNTDANALNLGLALGSLSAIGSNTFSPFLDLSQSSAISEVPACPFACSMVNSSVARGTSASSRSSSSRETLQRGRDVCLSLPECEWCEYEVTNMTRFAYVMYQNGRGLLSHVQPASRTPGCREQRTCYQGVAGLSPFYLSENFPVSANFRTTGDASPSAFEQFVFTDDFFVHTYMHALWQLAATSFAYPADAYPSNVIVNLPSAFAPPLTSGNAPPSADSPEASMLDSSAYTRLLPLGPIVGAVMGCIILAGVVVYCYRHYTQENYRHLQPGQLNSSNNSIPSGNARLDARSRHRGPHGRGGGGGGGRADGCPRLRGMRVGNKRKSAQLNDEECQLDTEASETNSIEDTAEPERPILSREDVTAKVSVPRGAASHAGIPLNLLYEGVGVPASVNHSHPPASVPVGSAAVVAAVSPYHIHFDGDDLGGNGEVRGSNGNPGGPVSSDRSNDLLTDQSSSVVAVSSLANDRAEQDCERERGDALSPLVPGEQRRPGPLSLGGGSDLGYSSTIVHDGTSSTGRTDIERASNVEEPHGAHSKADDEEVDQDVDDDEDEIVPVEDQSVVDGDDNDDETDGDSRSERTSTVASGSTAKAVVNASSKRPANSGAVRRPASSVPFAARPTHYSGAPAFTQPGSYQPTTIGYAQPVGRAFVNYSQPPPASSAGCYVTPYGVMRPARHQQVAYALVHRSAYDNPPAQTSAQQMTRGSSVAQQAQQQPSRSSRQSPISATAIGTQPSRPIFTAPSIPPAAISSKLPAISEKHVLGDRGSGEFSVTAPIADPNPSGVAVQSAAASVNMNPRLLEESCTDSGLGAPAIAAQSQSGSSHSPRLAQTRLAASGGLETGSEASGELVTLDFV